MGVALALLAALLVDLGAVGVLLVVLLVEAQAQVTRQHLAVDGGFYAVNETTKRLAACLEVLDHGVGLGCAGGRGRPQFAGIDTKGQGNGEHAEGDGLLFIEAVRHAGKVFHVDAHVLGLVADGDDLGVAAQPGVVHLHLSNLESRHDLVGADVGADQHLPRWATAQFLLLVGGNVDQVLAGVDTPTHRTKAHAAHFGTGASHLR